MSKEQDIIKEITQKVTEYENSMSAFQAEVGEWGDIYKVRRPQRKKNTFSNPRLTEFHRACNALATLSFRMMTAKDPYFGILPVDFNPPYEQLDTLNHVFKTQLKYSKYKSNLLKACNFLLPFGTVICQEDYRLIGVSPFGRQIPVTTFLPRVLDQVAFDRGTTDIEDADWISTSDITSSKALLRIAEEADTIKIPWNKKALEAAANDEERTNTINSNVLSRLTRDGSTQESVYKSKKELIMYYGKLDTLNDDIEYVAALVNRKFLVRFHANKFQHGKRQFRVARWINFDQALGLGLGQLLAKTHKSMDANRQRIQDNITMAAYNMWKRKKNTVDDSDFKIGPLNIVNVENMDDIAGLNVPTDGAAAGLKLEEVLKQEFRAASGATDTMQAIITEATASEVSLAQNEGMRQVSVRAEDIAESLVRDHIEVMHWNNVQNIKTPFNINRSGISQRVYPIDLKIDLDFEARVLTDKDFKPQRLDKLLQLIQMLISTKSDHPDQAQLSVTPLVKQAAYMLDVNPQDLMRNPTQPMMGAQELGGMAGPTVPPPDMSGMFSTPVGPVLASP